MRNATATQIMLVKEMASKYNVDVSRFNLRKPSYTGTYMLLMALMKETRR